MEDWERARGELVLYKWGWCCQKMCNKFVNHLCFGMPNLATRVLEKLTQRRSRAARKQVE